MIVSPGVETLQKLVAHQIHNLFFLSATESAALDRVLPAVLQKTEVCFRGSSNKYYTKDGQTFFSVYHSGQYCIFLYFLAREVFLDRSASRDLADKVYYLNKALNSLDLYYEVEMPPVFHLDHPLGAVLGRAVYGMNFTFSQQCTVGNNKGVYPCIGDNVQMLSGSKILGHCHIGDNVVLAANAYVKDTDIPPDSIVFGSSPDLTIKARKAE
ncbi:LbetaH domain-containing protein [Halopseudomonas salegens]|uniref:Serine O-acetyltransferase n=1 Tax=Halopseudomonas salegens TaxID=1434072 RepID=A0A1H2EJQ2_9GAMM|nr:transferase [Halopseudomonas salegens]SDT95337.1 serine O-acetyltransferase [Halopseudomonas salegens]